MLKFVMQLWQGAIWHRRPLAQGKTATSNQPSPVHTERPVYSEPIAAPPPPPPHFNKFYHTNKNEIKLRHRIPVSRRLAQVTIENGDL